MKLTSHYALLLTITTENQPGIRFYIVLIKLVNVLENSWVRNKKWSSSQIMSVRLFCVTWVDLSVLGKKLNRPTVCSCSTGWRTRELKTEISFNVSNESRSSDVIVLVERKTGKTVCCPLPYLLKISRKKSKVLTCTRLQPDRRRSDRRWSASWKILYHLKSCFQSYRSICSAIVCIKNTHCHHEGRIAIISLIGIDDCKWWLVAEDIFPRCWDSVHAEDIDKLIDEECK